MRLVGFGLIGVVFLLACAGCSRGDADFRLPAPEGRADPALRFTWDVTPGPILTRGKAGEFDSVDIRKPSVDAADEMFYSGFDGMTWRTGVTRDLVMHGFGAFPTKTGEVFSPDPSRWEGHQFSAANQALFTTSGGLLVWYQAGTPSQIGVIQGWTHAGVHARFRPRRVPLRHPTPVLSPGPPGSWDAAGVSDPCAVEFEGEDKRLYLFYAGTDENRRQRLGVARSSDGLVWEKNANNPILEAGAAGDFDERGQSAPAVWHSHGRYWMLYTGRARDERRAIGLAESVDGKTWRKSKAAPVLRGKPGTWMSHVVRDPAVRSRGYYPGIRVWFAGGNIATPDGAASGIGLAHLNVAPGQSDAW